METNRKTDHNLYIAGLYIFSIIAVMIVIKKITGVTLADKIPPCMFHRITGYQCPGCGGTRAVLALFHGDIRQSLLYHPIVGYTVLLGGWFMISQTAEHMTKGRIRIGMHYRNIYLWIALGIVCVHFVTANLKIFFAP